MMSTHHDHSQAQEATAQPSPETPRKRVRIGCVLALVGMLAMYVAGLYSRPLLFEANEDTSAGNNIVQTDALARDEPTLDLQGFSVTQAYQTLAREMGNLSSRNYADPELEARLATLEQEVRQLRVLNPYYRFKEIRAEVISTGIPDTYGAVLNVSFDQVQASVNVMSNFDPTYGKDRIVLEGADLERYIRM